MIVLAAADAAMRDWADRWKSHHARHCRYGIYDLGGLGYGQRAESPPGDLLRDEAIGGLPPCLFKPRVILHALRHFDEPVLWLDADAFLMRSIGPELLADVDGALTVRRTAESRDLKRKGQLDNVGTINAGVAFFNPTPRAIDFLRQWIACSEERGGDQRGLVKLTGHCWRRRGTVDRGKARLRLLATDDYNCWYFDEPATCARASILHFRGADKPDPAAFEIPFPTDHQ